MHSTILLLLGVTCLVSAYTIRDPSSNKELTFPDDFDFENPPKPIWEITIGKPTQTHSLKTCWVRVWVIKFCTFVIPDTIESEQQLESQEEVMEPIGESESCDKLGCQMFCKKNHFKRGICHAKGCECDFE